MNQTFDNLIPTTADTERTILARIANSQAQTLGAFGADLYADTALHSGTWGAIFIQADTIFATLTATNLGGTWTGVTFVAGTYLFGRFTAIDLTSGTVIAYRSA